MKEAEIVKRTPQPITVESLIADLGALGLERGDVVLVHTSLSAIGWIAGGPVAVIEALLGALGEDGTLMMPTHTASNTDPQNWQNPPVPEEWWPIIRDGMPPFHPGKTPTVAMGKVAECFRSWPKVRRSKHPVGSFAACGPRTEELLVDHGLDRDLFGEESPIGRLYELDGKLLLLGVGHDSNTSLHLAEYRSTCPKTMIAEGAAVEKDKRREWVAYEMTSLESDDFPALGKAYEATMRETEGRRGFVGQASSLLSAQRPLVDFGEKWLDEKRSV